MIVKGNGKQTVAQPYITIMECKFERVHRFVYWWSLVNENSDMKEEIIRWIQNANRCYYGLQRHFKSQLLTHEIKVWIYKTLLRPVQMYGSETQSDELHDVPLKGKYYVKYVVQCKRKESEESGTVKNCTSFTGHWMLLEWWKWRGWLGHVQRMGNNEIPRRIMDFRLKGRRTVGRPKLRWIDGVVEDLRKLGIQRW